MGRHELTDAQWVRLAPLLPPCYTGRRGRPYHDHRRIINGMLWIAKTGAPWRDLPACYGPWQTVASRFYRWQRSGRWAGILAELQRQADRRGELNWEQHYVDGTVVRAHQHAAGARHSKGGRSSRRSAGVVGDSAPSCTCAPRVAASRLRSWLRQGSATSRVCLNRS
jgi:transposase